jgi:hypothetical protein
MLLRPRLSILEASEILFVEIEKFHSCVTGGTKYILARFGQATERKRRKRRTAYESRSVKKAKNCAPS